jgi:hypothetical protein
MLRFCDLPTHGSEVVDLTSLTGDELTALIRPFEEAFLGDMAEWTLHGRRRQARRYTTDKNGPLPTSADRLRFILVYLKQHPTQRLQGRLFGRRQSKATQWIHVLLPVLRTTLRTLGDAPWRHIEALREQLRVTEPPVPTATAPGAAGQAAPVSLPPLVVMTGPNDPSRAPRTRLNSKRVRAARTSGTCGKTSS